MAHFTKKKLTKAIQTAVMTTTLASSLVFSQNDYDITVVTRTDILNTGLNNIGDVLNELVITSNDSINQFNNNGGDGSVRVSLGQFGSSRVLVLLNDKRMVTNGVDAFDFSSIPLSIVERIEVSRGDFNKKYGTGAISGIINIITKEQVEGIHTSAYYGKSDKNDAETQNYNISLGKSTDRGSLFFNAEFAKNAPIMAGDRDISALPRFGTGNANGSSATPQGRFILFSPLDGGFINSTTTPESNGWNTPDDPDLNDFTDENRYNFAPGNYLLTPEERKSVFIKGQYQLNNNLSLTSELLFNRRESELQLAPEPLSFGFFTGSILGDSLIGIGGQNPYNPYGVDIPTTYIGFIARRLVEAGNRKISQKVDSFQFNLGLDGFIDKGNGWQWQAGYTKSTSKTKEHAIVIDRNNLTNSLSNACVTGDILNCVPLNLFGGAGTITQEMLNYILADDTDNKQTEVDVFNIAIQTTLFQTSAGDANLNIGYEYRNHEINYQYHSGVFTRPLRQGNAANIEGSYQLNSLFADVNVPLIKQSNRNVLSLNLFGQYLDYDFTKGEAVGGLGFGYSPIKSLHLSLDYSANKKAPPLNTLFEEKIQTGLVSLNDPCIYDINLPGCPDSIPDGAIESPAQLYTSGNQNLGLEKSKTVQFNINYQPESFKNLNLNAKWFKQKLSDVVPFQSEAVATIVNRCAITGKGCENVIRDVNGVISSVTGTYRNSSAKLKYTGVEFSSRYKITTDFATFKLNWNNLINLDSKTTQINADGTSVDFNNLTLENNDTEIPRLKSNLNLSITKNNWDINYQIRYIAGREETCDPFFDFYVHPTIDSNTIGGVIPEDFRWCTYDSGEPLPDVGSTTGVPPILHDLRHISGSSFHDINVKYSLHEYQANITVGIENIFDKTPPLSSTAQFNSYQTELYNGTGRYFWLRINKEF